MVRRLPVQEDVAQERAAHRLHRLRRNQVDPGSRRGVGGHVVGDREARHARARGGQRVELAEGLDRVAREDLVASAEVVIDTEAALVVIVRADLGGLEHVRADIGQRVETGRSERDRIQHLRRNPVFRKRLTDELVDQRNGLPGRGVGEPGKIAGALGRRRHDGGLRLAFAVALPFVIGEEKVLVLADGTAESGAVLVAVQRLGGGGEEVPRIHGVVAEELVEIAVEGVTARLRHHRCGGAGGLPVLRRGVERQDAELAHGVHRRSQGVSAVDSIDVAAAIEQVVVRLRPRAVDRVRLAAARDAACLRQARRHRSDTRLEQTELRQIAAVQRQIDRLFLEDHVADGRAGVYGHRFSGDVHFAVFGGELQRHGPGHYPIDIDANGGSRVSGEAGRLHLERVHADGQAGEVKFALARRLNGSGQTGLYVANTDRGVRNKRLARIRDAAFQGSDRDLRPASGAKTQKE